MPSTNELCTELLMWLFDNGFAEGNQANLDDFPAKVEERINETELRRASGRLERLNLIAGITAAGAYRLLLAWTTSEGEQCAEEFRGDIEKWENRHVSKWDQSVHVQSGGDAQVAAHAHDVTQVQAGGDVNIGKLAEAAQLASESLPVLGLPDDVKRDVQEVIKGILEEAKKDEPDQKKAKGLGERLKSGLTLAAGSATVVRFINDALQVAGVM